MKSFKVYKGKHDKFSLRKKNVGLVSVAIASLAICGLTIGAPTVQAEENTTGSSLTNSGSVAETNSSFEKSTSALIAEEGTAEKVAATETNSTPTSTVAESKNTETPSQKVEKSEENLPVSKVVSESENANTASANTTTPVAVGEESPVSPESEQTEKSTNIGGRSAFRSAGLARTHRSAQQSSTQMSGFSVTVTTADGTVMNAGDTKDLSAQEIVFQQVRMKFELTQDGTLAVGSKIRIPVKLTNNAYAAYYSNLGTVTEEAINGVGTIKFDSSKPNDLAYVITINNDFVTSVPNGTQKAVEVTQRAATDGKFTAKSSYENIVLEINGSEFTFKPKPRTFEKASANFAVYNGASSDRANSIKLGVSTGDANYYNNLLSSDGVDAGNTRIPSGDIISIHRIKPGTGSKIISITPDKKRYTSTLAIGEDGKYLVRGDTSTSISITSDPDNKLVDLPANSTDEVILKALQKVGKNSSAVIDNGDGTYTVAINLGKMIGDGMTTYHDIWPTDDYAEYGDQFQEINRTAEVNRKVSSILKNASVIQGTGHSTRIIFADSSIQNTITNESKSYSYSVDENGNGTKIKEENISAKTTPSNARATGQQKITVHYLNTAGETIETLEYGYGYPPNAQKPQSPDFKANPKSISGYTLLTTPSTVTTVVGRQLTTSESLSFTNADQEFYYVYQANAQKLTYTVVDDTAGTTLEDRVLLETGVSKGVVSGQAQTKYDQVVAGYLAQNYELVSQEALPTQFDTNDATDQNVTVHLRHKTVSAAEEKTVTETIHYVYEGGGTAKPDYTHSLKFTRTATTDLVTNITTGEWTAQNGTSFPAVTSPVITGYTADKAIVAAVDHVTADSADIEETVVYKANAASAKVTYIDDDDNYRVLETKDLNGYYGQVDLYRTAETIKKYTDNNYELVSDNYPSAGVTYNETYQTFEVHLRHKTVPVEETKTVTETIQYVYEDASQAAASKVQTLEFKRTNTKDLVAGRIIQEGVWSPSESTFPAVTSPVITGYTADKAIVAAVDHVTAASADIEETVVYKANAASAKVTYIDDDDNYRVLETKDLNGYYGQVDPYQTAETIKKYTDNNYELVSDNYPSAGVTYDETIQTFEVHLKHGIATSQESKAVSLTVRYHGAGAQTPADYVQTAIWTRTVTKDKVTGAEVSSTPWVSDKATYDAVPSPVIAGYSVDVATVPAETVTQEDLVKDVYYSIQTQKVTYTVVDDTAGTTLEGPTKLTTGPSGAVLPAVAQTQYNQAVAGYLAQGYELVSQEVLPTQFDTDSSVDQNVVVHLKHGTATSQESKAVSLTVRYHGAGAQTPADHVQTAIWTRTVTKDKVTGAEVSTTPWATDKTAYNAVPSPVIAGYSVDVAMVPAETVTQEDLVKDVYYTLLPIEPEFPDTPAEPEPPVIPTVPDTLVPTVVSETPDSTYTLPRTGEDSQNAHLISVAGIGVLLSVIGIGVYRKKED